MDPKELKKLISAKKYAEVVEYVKTLTAKGKGPDAIATSLRRKFPELASPLVRHGWLSVIRPLVPRG